MPKIVDHDSRRDELLFRALGIFARRGYAGLSVRDLARDLGVSTGTIYHYFDSKEAIFRGIFERIAATDVDLIASAVPPTASPAERLDALVQLLQDHGDRLQQAVQIALEFARSDPDPEGQALLKLTLARYREALSQLSPRGDLLATLIIGLLVERSLDPIEMDLRARLHAALPLLGGDQV